MPLATVELRTTLLPPLTVSTDDLTSKGGGAAGGAAGGAGAGTPAWSLKRAVLSLVRPAWTVTSPVYNHAGAPYGEPGEAWQLVLPTLALVLVSGVALAFYGLVTLLRRRPHS